MNEKRFIISDRPPVHFDNRAKQNMFDAYKKARHRLILLDYDGTMVPFASHPGDAKPGNDVKDLLCSLSVIEGNEVVIISGRNAEWLERQLGDLSLWMIAEHGATLKLKNGEWQNEVSRSDEWKQQIKKIMENHVSRCANTFVEEKVFTMVWHFRNANAGEGKLHSIGLYNELNEQAEKLDLQVLMGNKIVEVRTQGTGKHIAIKKILRNSNYDFILAIGDDRTDEDMFELLADRSDCFTIKVGNQASHAKYHLVKQKKVITLLEEMSKLKT